MIAWKYIDKRAVVIAVLRDYNNNQMIIINTPDDIKTLYNRMVNPRSARVKGMPRAHNPRSGEDKIASSLDALDAMQERYRHAVEYMTWFEPAWGTLTELERKVLSEFYMSVNQKSGATYRLMTELNYSERKVEQLRGNALKRLRVLLLG